MEMQTAAAGTSGQGQQSDAAIAQRLREARRGKGWTRVRLYVESGVHPNTIADIENARNRQPSFEKVVRLARALSVPPEQLCPVSDVPRET